MSIAGLTLLPADGPTVKLLEQSTKWCL